MNVISIVLDTFRNDIVGEGKKLSYCQTPNLDQFRAGGIAFEGAHGEGQPTLQIRRAFFTGRRSFPWRYNFDRRGLWHHQPGWHKIPPEQDTIAEILTRHGYYTGMVADTYHMFKPSMNYTRGFVNYDFVRGQESDNWRGGTYDMIEDEMRKRVREPINWRKHATLAQYLFNMRGREREEDYLCARVCRRASEWLEECHRNAPFFLWVECFDPHEPWDPPSEYADLYCSDYEGKDFVFPGAAYENQEPTERELERIKALYLGEVTLVDKWVGTLFDKITELNLWDDTIVMVLSDHGTQLMDHGRFGKGGGNLRSYNTGIVWYMRHPDGPSGKVVDAYVQSHDVMPTLLSLLGVPHWTEGMNVWPLVTGEADRLRDHIVTGWCAAKEGRAGSWAAVRDEEWLYWTAVHEDDPNAALFRLPDEEDNVRDEHPEVVARQRRRIEAVLNQPMPAMLNEVSDPGPPPWAEYLMARNRAASDVT